MASSILYPASSRVAEIRNWPQPPRVPASFLPLRSAALLIGEIVAHQDCLGAGIGACAADGLDRRARRIDREEGGRRYSRHRARRRSRLRESGLPQEIPTTDFIRQILGEPGNLQQRSVATFLVTNPQRDPIGRGRGHRQREGEGSSSHGCDKTCRKTCGSHARAKSSWCHGYICLCEWFRHARSAHAIDAWMLRNGCPQSMKRPTEYSPGRARIASKPAA